MMHPQSASSQAPIATAIVLVFLAIGQAGVLPVRLLAADFESYGQARDFLVSRTDVVELTGENGERVAICPKYQGRIMTSTTSDLQGPSFGWINRPFIEKGEQDRHFNNYGGEDRFWLGPEGGPYSLWFAPGVKQDLDHWLTPKVLNEGAFEIVSSKQEPNYRLARRLKFTNTARTQFDLEVSREIHLQKAHDFGQLFGSDAQAALQNGGLRMVGFQSINTITNRGQPMTREKGLVSIWSLGQFPAGSRTFVILPYQQGDAAKLGPPVNSEYFGPVPPDRLRVTSQAIWFLADGHFRSKIGVSQLRAKRLAGAIDLKRGVLTLVHFTMPDDPSNFSYVNNEWGRQAESYRGDVANSYNDGPPESGRPALGGFFEIESLSPAAQLPTGKSLSHTQTTFHITGSAASLARVAKAALGVDVKVNDAARGRAKQ
jgi:hypothetical protein